MQRSEGQFDKKQCNYIIRLFSIFFIIYDFRLFNKPVDRLQLDTVDRLASRDMYMCLYKTLGMKFLFLVDNFTDQFYYCTV